MAMLSGEKPLTEASQKVGSMNENQQEFAKINVVLQRLFYGDDKMARGAQKMMAGGGDKATAMGKAAAQITQLVDKKIDMPGKMVIPAGMTALTYLAESAQARGEIELDDKLMSRATQVMVKQLMGSYGVDEKSAAKFVTSQDPAQVEQALAAGQEIEGQNQSSPIPGGSQQ